jgi:hypothetical protein
MQKRAGILTWWNLENPHPPQKVVSIGSRFINAEGWGARSREAGGFGSDVTACIAPQPHTVLQAKYAEMDGRSPKATEKRAGEGVR